MTVNQNETDGGRNPLVVRQTGFDWSDPVPFTPELPGIITRPLPLLKQFETFLPNHHISKDIFREVVDLSRINLLTNAPDPDIEQRYLATQMSILTIGDGTGLIGKLYGTCKTSEDVRQILRNITLSHTGMLHDMSASEKTKFIQTARGEVFDPQSLLILDSIQQSLVQTLTDIQAPAAKKFREDNVGIIQTEGMLFNEHFIRYNDSYSPSTPPYLIHADHMFRLFTPKDKEVMHRIQQLIPDDLHTGAIPLPTAKNLLIRPEHILLLLPIITHPFLRGEIAYLRAHPLVVDNSQFNEHLAEFYQR